ncbi:PhnD/SsuA/transferrin family substrate-binding protein [Haloferax volcanii]|jgi:phosphonate transport system substrate-binding protein|uniref:PhnD/SsuA/transferrin family substrate-binding protein n=1 Tax=Haloferax volcanii TaxID=2246 RepID=UPI00249C75C3|nr:PhnD/SsuA/transferrin family substrate-binding protein [Haloferax alexandrinus]
MLKNTVDTKEAKRSTVDTSRSSRRGFIAGAGAAGIAALAGCTGGSGSGSETQGAVTSSASQSTEITILLTPENPTEVKKDYMPMKKYLEDQISGLKINYRVPLDYSAILPALKSEQAEMGMDDITLIAASDKMDVMGTAVTGGTAFYYSMMMTKPGSSISKPSDVEGKTMAFADSLSTSGSIYALYELKNAGLDIGEAPGSDKGAAFQGSWSNHKAALEQLTNDKADACSTWGGNGVPYVPKSDLPSEVKEKSAYVDEAGSKSPELDVFLWSEPIPKQPIYSRSTWDDPIKDTIEKTLHEATESQMKQYKGDDYDGALPFTTLNDTSMDDYQPIIKRVNELGIDLTQDE